MKTIFHLLTTENLPNTALERSSFLKTINTPFPQTQLIQESIPATELEYIGGEKNKQQNKKSPNALIH